MEDSKELKKKVIVTGGGSGGHVSTASSIISTLKKKYTLTENNFLYIGGDLSMESEKPGNSLEKKIFRKENFNQEYIRAGKLQRTISFKSILRLARVTLGFIDSFKIIRKFKSDIVISTGGFVSVPVCIVAKIFKAEIYLHEQTAAVGLSNKIVGKFATKIFITYPSSREHFPEEKVVHTGNLIREEIFKESGVGNTTLALKKMLIKQENYPIVYISGGSLGSHNINMTVKDSLLSLLQDFQVVLQTGDNKKYNDYEILLKEKKKLRQELQERFFPVKYIDNEEIGFLLSNIDLFVGRAGANTVYEMGLLRIPSILIPIPWVTHNEQEKNALILKEAGLAEILNEGELTPEQLTVTISRFYKKEKLLDNDMIQKTFILNAGEKILESIGL